MRSKEEILQKHYGKDELSSPFIDIFNAMSEYAKEVAIEFHIWAYKNTYSKYWGSDKPNKEKWYKGYTMPDRTYYTHDELFELFKKENNI